VDVTAEKWGEGEEGVGCGLFGGRCETRCQAKHAHDEFHDSRCKRAVGQPCAVATATECSGQADVGHRRLQAYTQINPGRKERQTRTVPPRST
jgi:hypothetical protein